MSSPEQLPFAVIGATGHQGRAVIEPLLAAGASVRALVRDPDSPASRDLAGRGVALVRADQDDVDSMTAALSGVDALFMMTTYDGGDGTDGEIRHGYNIAAAAVAADVPRVVYSSVGGAERSTGIPHFESKRRVEERLEASLPSLFVRPTFFMENLGGPIAGWTEGEFVLRLPLPADIPMQMVSVRDIGRVSARLLLEPALVGQRAIEIAGDELTATEIAARIGEKLGTPARYEELPIAVLDEDGDRQAMFRWFLERPSYRADFSLTRTIDPDVEDLRAWLTD